MPMSEEREKQGRWEGLAFQVFGYIDSNSQILSKGSTGTALEAMLHERAFFCPRGKVRIVAK